MAFANICEQRRDLYEKSVSKDRIGVNISTTDHWHHLGRKMGYEPGKRSD